MLLKDDDTKRFSGVLLAISSLPSVCGIGTLGKAAYDFVDFLAEAKQRFWQILPLNPLSEGNSPYKSVSCFAGEILYIDLQLLVCDGLLAETDLLKLENSDSVNYEKVREQKLPLLFKAAANFNVKSPNYKKFLKQNDWWLQDYALFITALSVFKTDKIRDLPQGIKYRLPEALTRFKTEYEKEIEINKILQYFFYCQYYALKRYANGRFVKIIGDIPFYVAADGCDVWVNPDEFYVDLNFKPTLLAGVPPDKFSPYGQLWGNPIYNWDNMRENGYRWWQTRLKFCSDLYDVLRIDHFRAFANYYCIKSRTANGLDGTWRTGVGTDFWNKIKENVGEINIIAEDLGGEDDLQVKKLLQDTKFADMRVLQFAFTGDVKNGHLPQNYPYNCVCYTATHDNDATYGWYNSASIKEKAMAKSLTQNGENNILHNMIRELSKSKSMLCIIPMQDLLCLGSSARMNVPGTENGNWQWRLKAEFLNHENAKLLKRLTAERNR